MRLTHHIALRFLCDNNMIYELMEAMHPGIIKTVVKSKPIPGDKEHRIIESDEEGPEKKYAEAWNEDFPLLNNENQKAYVVTASVDDKLDLLKVKRDPAGLYDWSVFAEVRPCKKTFILPQTPEYKAGRVLRVLVQPGIIYITYLRGIVNNEISTSPITGHRLQGQCMWTILKVSRLDNEHTRNVTKKEVQEFYELAYKLLCFFFLSENDIEVVQPGGVHGQKKTGKFKNDLPIPVRVINSKWNITSIRTEGFMVSGHFALRRCGPGRTASRMVYIEPFQKHGYIRRGGKEYE